MDFLRGTASGQCQPVYIQASYTCFLEQELTRVIPTLRIPQFLSLAFGLFSLLLVGILSKTMALT